MCHPSIQSLQYWYYLFWCVLELFISLNTVDCFLLTYLRVYIFLVPWQYIIGLVWTNFSHSCFRIIYHCSQPRVTTLTASHSHYAMTTRFLFQDHWNLRRACLTKFSEITRNPSLCVSHVCVCVQTCYLLLLNKFLHAVQCVLWSS